MSVYFIKQPSSRPIVTTTSTANPFKTSGQSYQLRIVTSSAGSVGIGDSSSTSAMVSVPFAANVHGEYVAVTPGQWILPCAGMTVTEVS